MKVLVKSCTVLLVMCTYLLVPGEARPYRRLVGIEGSEVRHRHHRHNHGSKNERGAAGQIQTGARINMHTGMNMHTPASNMDKIMEYFVKYDYFGGGMNDFTNFNMNVAMHKATRLFQHRYVQYGLKETGEVDEDTMALMMKPRCGVPDGLSMNAMSNRKKRYLLSGIKWNKTEITYNLTQYPQNSDLSHSDVDAEIRRAFAVWEEVTPLKFINLKNKSLSQAADIEIRFVPPYYNHGDGLHNAFDGKNGMLAHAYFPYNAPIGGDTHFDDGELWTLRSFPDGRGDFNLFQVAAHEFGHALGLRHSNDRSALMAPFYPGYIPNFVLPLDDVKAIQELYGRPGICKESSFDAITTVVVNGEHKIYGFKGKHYVLINENIGGGVVNGYPRLISEGWSGLPDSIDAALFWDERMENVLYQQEEAVTYIFKGDLYWEIRKEPIALGPWPISDWGLPKDIDAAFVWGRNNKTYIFKGDQYYRYTRGVGLDSGYPRSSSVWGLPNNIDAAFQFSNGKSYFFKDDQFYAYDDVNIKVESGYPLNSYNFWFKC